MQSGNTIKIATIFPTLGRYALSGRQSHNGARLAVEKINAAGGILGRLLELMEYRTGSYLVDASWAADLVIEEGSALAIVGANSSDLSKAIARKAEPEGLVQISNVSTVADVTWDPVTKVNREFIFRVCHTDTVVGRNLAQFAREFLEVRRVAVLYEAGRTYSQNLGLRFIQSFRGGDDDDSRTGCEAVAFLFPEFEIDFVSRLNDIHEWGAEAIFVPGSFTEATLIATQAEQLGMDLTFLGGDSWSNSRLFKQGGPGRPSYHTDHWYPEGPFVVEYEKRFSEKLNGARAPLAHDAITAIAEALEALGPLEDGALKPGSDEFTSIRRRFRDELTQVDFTGVTGRIRFDGNGDARKGCAIIQVDRLPGGAFGTRLHPWKP